MANFTVTVTDPAVVPAATAAFTVFVTDPSDPVYIRRAGVWIAQASYRRSGGTWHTMDAPAGGTGTGTYDDVYDDIY